MPGVFTYRCKQDAGSGKFADSFSFGANLSSLTEGCRAAFGHWPRGALWLARPCELCQNL
jgi:hypothetical protein